MDICKRGHASDRDSSGYCKQCKVERQRDRRNGAPLLPNSPPPPRPRKEKPPKKPRVPRLFNCLIVGHESGYYSNGQCKDCRRAQQRQYEAAQRALLPPPLPGERGSGVCRRGHVNPVRNKHRGCQQCKIDLQRERRRAVGPGKRSYPVAGTPYICRRGHNAISGEGCGECAKITNRHNRNKPDNKAKQKERYDKWRAENPDKVVEASRRWQIAHPEEMQVIRTARTSAKKNAPGRLTASEWKAILKKHKHRCAYCGEKPRPGELTQDHVVPLQGKDVRGTHYAFNIVPACRACNTSKNNRVLPGTQHSIFDKILA